MVPAVLTVILLRMGAKPLQVPVPLSVMFVVPEMVAISLTTIPPPTVNVNPLTVCCEAEPMVVRSPVHVKLFTIVVVDAVHNRTLPDCVNLFTLPAVNPTVDENVVRPVTVKFDESVCVPDKNTFSHEIPLVFNVVAK